MTTGEKIKYLRGRLGITQAQLAAMTGIHIVTIKKYETNKVQPLPAQIERLAPALGVGCIALSGLDKSGLRVQTVGDLLGLIMALTNISVLQFIGERDQNNRLTLETAKLQLNPIFNSSISLFVKEDRISISDLLFHVKFEHFLNQLLDWERLSFLYNRAISESSKPLNSAEQAMLQDTEYRKSCIELEMQRSQILLHS